MGVRQVLVIGLFFLTLIGGCLSAEEEEIPNAKLDKISLGGVIKVRADSQEVLPFLSARILNDGLRMEIDETGIRFDNLSRFSSELALGSWKSPENVFVVDSYESALGMTTASKLLDAPILLYGPTTDAVLDMLNPGEIVIVGDLNIVGDVVLKSNEIHEYTINLLKSSNVLDGYVTVINVDRDADNRQGLAEFGSMLCACRNGILITINSSFSNIDIKEKIMGAVDIFNESGINMSYLCLVGGFDVMPSYKKEIEISMTADSTYIAECFTDNPYCCYGAGTKYETGCCGGEEKVPLPDFACGRIPGVNLSGLISLFEKYRSCHFCLEKWMNKALIYNFDEVNDAAPGVEYSIVKTTFNLTVGGFSVNVKPSPLSRVEDVQGYIEESNFIYIVFDKKHKDSGDDTYSAIDLNTLALFPATIFDTTGFSGLDGEVSVNDGGASHQSENIPRKIFKAGAVAYIAPTGDAIYTTCEVGLPFVTRDDTVTCLARLFFEALIKNKTAGNALMEAKKEFMKVTDMDIDPGSSILTVCEFTLYGDPAFNPYEPCNEGTNYGS